MSEYEKGAALMLVASASDEYGDSERKYCGALSAIYHRLHDGREMDLRPGMLVQWKPNLKNRKSPEYGKPAIVIEMLSPPVIDGTFESGSTYFREPLDIIIGFVDEDGDFLNYHADARRFEPYSGPGS